MAQTAYGVDIQGDEPVVVGVRASGLGRPEYFNADAADLSPSRVVSVGLSDRVSFTQWLTVPYASSRKARKVLPTVLDIQLPFELEQCTYEFVSAAVTINREFECLGVAARNRDIAAFLESLAPHRLDPCIVDHEGLALWSQAAFEHPVASGTNEPRVLIHAGKARSSLVLGRGGRFLNSHTLNIADGASVKRLIRAALGDAAGSPEWIWAGSALDEDPVRELRESLERDFGGRQTRVNASQLFLARGLARRALKPDKTAVNFRRGTFAHSAAEEGGQRTRATAAVLMLAAGTILIAASGWSLHVAGRALARTDRAFATVMTELLGHENAHVKGRHALAIAESHLTERRNEAGGLYSSRSLTEALTRIAETAAVQDLTAERITIDRKTLEVMGTGNSERACGELVPALESLGFTVSVETRPPREPGGRFTFVLQGEAS